MTTLFENLKLRLQRDLDPNVIAVFCIVLCLGAMKGVSWWSNRNPHRPSLVPATALYVQVSNSGTPVHPPGVWLACNSDGPRYRCVYYDEKGVVVFKDRYIDVIRKEQVPDGPIKLEQRNLGKEYVSGMSLIHLDNGSILVPASCCRAAVGLLQRASADACSEK